MAAKSKPMSQIKQILRFTQQGKSIKFIARNLSVSRNTVRKYLLLQQASGQSIDELLQLEDNQLQQALLPTGHPATDQRYQVLVDRYDYFCGELRRTGVTRWLLWSEYRQSHPGGYCYSQFCKHLHDLGDARNLTMANLPHPPASRPISTSPANTLNMSIPAPARSIRYRYWYVPLGIANTVMWKRSAHKKAKIWSMESGGDSPFSAE